MPPDCGGAIPDLTIYGDCAGPPRHIGVRRSQRGLRAEAVSLSAVGRLPRQALLAFNVDMPAPTRRNPEVSDEPLR